MRKRFFVIFAGLLGGLMLSACDEEVKSNSDWFATPRVATQGTTATVSCQADFTPSVLTSSGGFRFEPIDPVTDAVVEVSPVEVSGKTLSATCAGLAENTIYRVTAFVSVGTQRVESKPAMCSTAFATGR